MHIVSAADDGFVPHFCAMLHSAWLYNPDADYSLLASDISPGNLDLLRAFARERDIALEIIAVGAEKIAGLPLHSRFTASTWLRLLIPEALPQSVGRALYLDADITVNGSLDDLFALDMCGHPVAAVPDRQDFVELEKTLLRLERTSLYFNSGVMLLDLKKWREENIASLILAFGKVMDSRLGLMDQSALNHVLRGRIHRCDNRWNFFDLEQASLVPDPAIIHHSGEIKPWASSLAAFCDLYAFHRRNTPWPLSAALPNPGAGIRPWLKNRRRRIGGWLGVRRYRSLIEQGDRLEAALAGISDGALDRARRLLAGRNFPG